MSADLALGKADSRNNRFYLAEFQRVKIQPARNLRNHPVVFRRACSSISTHIFRILTLELLDDTPRNELKLTLAS